MPNKFRINVEGKNSELWSDIIVRKRPPKILLDALSDFPRRLVEKIGDEIMSSLKGKRKHIFHIKRKKRGEGITFRTTASSKYPYGIVRRKSPDGEPYAELSNITLKIRKIKKSKGKKIHLDEKFILRETDRNILYGMKCKVKKHEDGHSITIYWPGKKEDIAYKQNKGFTTTPYFKTEKKILVKVPARPFIGIQPALLDNLTVIYNKFYRSFVS